MPEIEQEDYKNVEGSSFIFKLEDGKELKLFLKKVTDIVKSGASESFSLEFHGPKDIFCPQGTYAAEHDSMGTQNLFLVPVGEGTDRYEYQSIFNDLVES